MSSPCQASPCHPMEALTMVPGPVFRSRVCRRHPAEATRTAPRGSLFGTWFGCSPAAPEPAGMTTIDY